ncbi:MAG TPA: DsbE family thiol:disulfide interchange protein [Methylococcaceae bacterium]|nr:DsbE family thiol:disulfide interchange protein [Methylococcaceae bacterium]
MKEKEKAFPRLLFILPLSLLLVLGVLYGYGLAFDPNKQPSRLIGKTLPLVTLPRLANTQQHISTAHFKTPAVINIWASWCGACRAEHELLMKIAAQQQFFVYGVAYQDDLDNARAYLQAQGNPFVETLFDGAMISAAPFEVLSVPQTYIVDKSGHIRARHIGKLTQEVWQALQATLNQGVN